MVVNFTHYITNLPAAVIVGENSSLFVIHNDCCKGYGLMIRGVGFDSIKGTVLYRDLDPLKVIRVYSAIIEAYANGCKLLNILDKGTVTTV